MDLFQRQFGQLFGPVCFYSWQLAASAGVNTNRQMQEMICCPETVKELWEAGSAAGFVCDGSWARIFSWPTESTATTELSKSPSKVPSNISGTPQNWTSFMPFHITKHVSPLPGHVNRAGCVTLCLVTATGCARRVESLTATGMDGNECRKGAIWLPDPLRHRASHTVLQTLCFYCYIQEP
jgi:hypothetical protein